MKRKNKMKKAVICLVLLASLLLCACNGNTEKPAEPSEPHTNMTTEKETNKPTEKSTENPTEKPTEKQTEAPNEDKPEDIPENTPEDTPEPPKAVFYETEYIMGSLRGVSGEFFTMNNRFTVDEFIKLEDIQAIEIKKGYNLSWFAYDGDKTYLGNGSNIYPTLPTAGIWLGDGMDVTSTEILAWNSDVKYVKLAVRKNDNSEIELSEDVKLSGIKIYESGYVRSFEYEGEKLGSSDTLSYEKVATLLSAQQDGAVCGDYFFSFNSSGVCTVYSVNGYTKITEFTVDKNNILSPHSNSVCFGSYYYDEADEFPLLYCNIYNTYPNDRSLDGTCNVYRITRNGNSFESELVQVITVGFTDDTSLWSSVGGDARPYGNFVVDTDNDKLYAFTMRSGNKQTRFFRFDLPTLNDGEYDSALGVNKVTLTASDIEERFDVEFFNYIQGATYHDGKIYSVEGFTNNTTAPAKLRVVDLEKQRVTTVVDLYGIGLLVEPEAINVIEGVLYYTDYNKNVYKIIFN